MRFSFGLLSVIVLFGVAVMGIMNYVPPGHYRFILTAISTVAAVVAGHIVLFKYVTDPPSRRY